VCCVLIPKGQAAVKNTSRQNARRSIQKRNQTANFSEHKKDQALWIYIANESPCASALALSPFLFSWLYLLSEIQPNSNALSARSNGGGEEFHQTFIFEHALTDCAAAAARLPAQTLAKVYR
jgi:hypothetical protein